jgi:hypothetical protein
VIFRALWNHLGHPLPTPTRGSNHAGHLQNSWSLLEGPPWCYSSLGNVDTGPWCAHTFAQFPLVSIWKCPNRRSRPLPKIPNSSPPCFWASKRYMCPLLWFLEHCGTIWVIPSQHTGGSPIMQDTSKILNLSWKVLLGAIVAWGMQTWDLDVLIHLPSTPQWAWEMSKQEVQTFA